MDDEVRITVIATGFEKTPFPKKEDAKKKTGSDRDWTRSFSGGGTATTRATCAAPRWSSRITPLPPMRT